MQILVNPPKAPADGLQRADHVRSVIGIAQHRRACVDHGHARAQLMRDQPGETRIRSLEQRARRGIVERQVHATAWSRRTSPERSCTRCVDRLVAAVDAQLAQDVLHVRAYGLVREDELVRDLGGGEIETQQVEHLPLARRERAAHRPHTDAVWPRATDPVHEPRCQPATDHRLPVHSGPQSSRQRAQVDRLGQKPSRAGSKADKCNLVILVRREHHHRDPGSTGGQQARRGDAIHDRHDDVHKDDVRLVMDAEVDGVTTVLGLRNRHDPGVVQGVAYGAACDWVVIGDDCP